VRERSELSGANHNGADTTQENLHKKKYLKTTEKKYKIYIYVNNRLQTDIELIYR